jgi:hypothetical protein
MKKFIFILAGTFLSILISHGQGKTLRLNDKDRGQDILTLIQRIQMYQLRGNSIFFNYELNSLNNPEGALIIIDGLKTGEDIDNLRALSVPDIESITVMTKPEDYAIYTSMNINGVIVVKTKRGNK